jgi:hypothetical protein
VEFVVLPFFTSALDGDEWSVSRPGCFTPMEIVPGKIQPEKCPEILGLQEYNNSIQFSFICMLTQQPKGQNNNKNSSSCDKIEFFR